MGAQNGHITLPSDHVPGCKLGRMVPDPPILLHLPAFLGGA